MFRELLKIMKLHIMQSSTTSCYLILLISTRSRL
jgi:hypothetical protein